MKGWWNLPTQEEIDKKYAMTDRMCSLMVQSQLQVEQDELKEAIKSYVLASCFGFASRRER